MSSDEKEGHRNILRKREVRYASHHCSRNLVAGVEF